MSSSKSSTSKSGTKPSIKFPLYEELKEIIKKEDPDQPIDYQKFFDNVRYLETCQGEREQMAFLIYKALLVAYYDELDRNGQRLFSYHAKIGRISYHAKSHPLFVRIVLVFTNAIQVE